MEGLSLCDNDIDDTDVFQLASALSKNDSKLSRLALTSNNIKDESVQHLAEMLKTNRYLTQLWLGFNQITNHGVPILTDVLAHHNKTLHVLSLSSNYPVTDSSLDFLINMLECNHVLRTVCLSNCGLTETSKLKLRETTASRLEFYIDL